MLLCDLSPWVAQHDLLHKPDQPSIDGTVHYGLCLPNQVLIKKMLHRTCFQASPKKVFSFLR